MIARKYNKYIGLIEGITLPDGFGGSIVTDFGFIYFFWANVETKRSYIINEIGKRSIITEVVFTIRNNNLVNITKNNLIFYNNAYYNIDSILNLDLNNIDIEITTSSRM